MAATVVVGPRVYSCCSCRNNVALHDDIVSKSFQGKSGRAFLFSHAMNISVGPNEDRQLMTGLHTVADVFCIDCNETLGWKYERAYEETQKYKEGKFILEKLKIVKDNWYLIASHTTDYQHPMLFFNTLAVMALVIAKFPNTLQSIFGINADQ